MTKKTLKTSEKREHRKEAPFRIEPNRFFGLPLDDDQLLLANTIWSKDYDIVFVNSVAGTGKTTIATGVAKLLVDYKRYNSIVYIMSPYGERQQGWLPGTIEEKSSVYFDAFYQALNTIGVNTNTDVVQESDPRQSQKPYISCITDTYLRGCNLNHAVVIIDEAQNFTIPQLKKILTRVCKDTKVVVIGHELQCDLDKPELSGFKQYIDHFKDQKRCAVCSLTTNHRGWISNHADTLRENGYSYRKDKPILFEYSSDPECGSFATSYISPFFDGEDEYVSVDQYMAANKAALFEDYASLELIMSCGDPKSIHDASLSIENYDSDLWDLHKEELMLKANYMKFEENSDLLWELLATGNREIIKAGAHDTVWGIGRTKDDPCATIHGSWRGQNLLGKILMQVRDDLRKEKIDE